MVLFASLALGACSSKVANNTSSVDLNSKSAVSDNQPPAQTSASIVTISPVPTETDEQLMQNLNDSLDIDLDSQFKQLETELN